MTFPENSSIVWAPFDPVLCEQSDSQFVQSLGWSSKSPKPLRRAAKEGNLSRLRRMLSARLSERLGHDRLPSLCSDRLHQAAWLFDKYSESTTDVLALELLLGLSRQVGQEDLENHLTAWLDSLNGGQCPLPHVAAACLTVLPLLPEAIDLDVWVRFWRMTLTSCRGLIEAIDTLDDRMTATDYLLVAGEIPYRAGMVFEEYSQASRWYRLGRKTLRNDLDDRTDTDGTPHAEIGLALTPWLGILCRTMSDARSNHRPLWPRRLESRAKELAAQSIAAYIPQRDPSDNEVDMATQLTLARLTGWKKKSAPVRYLLSVSESRVSSSGKSCHGHCPASQSDWAESAILRNHWGRHADTAAVTYHDESMNLSLAALGVPLISGEWPLALQVDGQAVEESPVWECVSWFSDEDADFIELAWEQSDGGTISRQLLLSRTDHLFIFSEAAVFPNKDAAITFQSTLPIEAGWKAESDGYTREIQFSDGHRRVRVFPITLPYERVVQGTGTIEVEEQALRVSAHGAGGCGQVWVLDWAPKRSQSPTDWTMLTVAEEGERIGPNQALAGRLRIGRKQWFYFRNLTKPDVPRSVLGHHTDNETVIGEIDSAGDIVPLVLVESE